MNGRIRGILLIEKERERQEEHKRDGRFLFSCADQEMNDYERLAILAEEFGEVAKEVMTGQGKRLAKDTIGTDGALLKELTQVAAVSLAWMEAINDRSPI